MGKVLVPFSAGVEEIELVTIVDILRRADITVCLASLDGKEVVGRSNIVIHAEKSLTDVCQEPWDMIVLPGGQPNANHLKENDLVKETVLHLANQGKYIAAICAAPAALAAFGITKNKRVTSHPSVQKEMLLQPSTTYLEQAVVEDGLLITSRGAGTALEFALCLVTKLCHAEKAAEIRQAILA